MDGPLIVQSDKTVLLEVGHPEAIFARADLAPFVELEKAPEYIHTYRISSLALWNARACGHDAETLIDVLLRYARFPPSQSLLIEITEIMARYGRLQLIKHPEHGLILTTQEISLLAEVIRHKKIKPMIKEKLDIYSVSIHPAERGRIKAELIKIGWPADDLAGYIDGKSHDIALKEENWNLRPYQLRAVEAFTDGGSGVIVLPCGAGKTIVGAATMATLKTTTLILVTNIVSVHQWKAELLKRTSLTEDEVGEYSSEAKNIRPITIATYSILTKKTKQQYQHLSVFDAENWGLIIYDEVHLLPAPVFRLTADLQSRRRLGLTATLVREDGRENDVFSLIGPKRYEVPWKVLEEQGWIASAQCTEVRVNLLSSEKMAYSLAEPDRRYYLSATTKEKLPIIEKLLSEHPDEQILIIGGFIDQLHQVGEKLSIPIVDGSVKTSDREKIFNDFRNGLISRLIVSKVANFSLDLPEASVAVQISGTYGSRQEEAQRLGRIVRPKKDGRAAYFYSIVARETIDADYAMHRQRFLTEQGYSYSIVDGNEVLKDT